MDIVSNQTNLAIALYFFSSCDLLGFLLALIEISLLADQVTCVFLVLSQKSEISFPWPSEKRASIYRTFFFWPICFISALSWEPIWVTSYRAITDQRRILSGKGVLYHTFAGLFVEGDHFINRLLGGKSPALAVLDLLWITTTFGDKIIEVQHGQAAWRSQ